MENDEDMKKGLVAIESESENAHRKCQQLLGFEKERPRPTVNRTLLYAEKCKMAFDPVSNGVCRLCQGYVVY